ncbi:MAG: insulinase family protein, partial [Muribaculaceae bacterium]|nr:insulinase family protein [Muribaculaceae bacterium]
MIRKILTSAVLTVSALFAGAQTPLPLNEAVKHGTLPNGLNYYILHNEEPKERVNFYIAQKVGSTLETPEQLGLAHFLEHMAFNGTTNFPGKTMLNYLQAKGIRFGADINAYTSFDETVYNIDNVPSTDKALVDSVLLVLHDWSGSILLEESEINAERGVIEEEWRSRNSAQQRMYEAMLPKIYQEYQYQQMPIGKMEIVRNFPPQAIRDYYHKWYRPDQQGIVIVGDIDAAEMEKKVIDLFSTIPMPENAAERTYPTVSDNEKPIYFYFNDKELRFPMIMVNFKMDKIPLEMRNTVEAYVQTQLVDVLLSTMINNRLNEYAKNPECKYVQAGVSFGDFFVSKTKAAFDTFIIPKGDVKEALDDAMGIVARACKTGFMESELVRARDELLARYEKLYNERNNTKTETLARELCRHFIDNEAAPGIEKEYELVKMILPMLPVQAFNQEAAQLLTAGNQVIVVSEPLRDGMTAISEEEITGRLADILNAQYEAYVDEVITDPLIEKLPAPGKIASVSEGQFGTTVFTLSNGAKVIVKPTDFKQDEIVMTAFKDGGKRAYDAKDAANVILAGDAAEVSKLGSFDQVKLGKYLAGKNVSLGYNIGNTVNALDGKSTVKDLPTFMEVLYATFTELNPDETAYNAYIDQIKTILKNNDKNPTSVFQRAVAKATYAGNPMFQQPSVELLESGNYARELEIVKSSLKNAADFTFIFTGNIDLDTFKPLVEQYIAALPSTGKKSAASARLSSINIAEGVVNDTFKQPMQVPSTMVLTNISGKNVDYSIANFVKVDLIGDILSNIFTDTLREEEGGTYSPYAYGTFNPFTGTWQIIYVFQTNDQMQEKLITRANEELLKLLSNGADEAN